MGIQHNIVKCAILLVSRFKRSARLNGDRGYSPGIMRNG